MKTIIRNVLKRMPLLMGLFAIIWFLSSEFNPSSLKGFYFTQKMICGVLLAFLFIILRDIFVTYRFRLISGNELSWSKALKVHILCEFMAAITPSIIGNGGIAIIFLKKEKIPIAKSSAITISLLFLDELFLTLISPIPLLFFSPHDLFHVTPILQSGIKAVFVSVYLMVILWTIFLYLALFRGTPLLKKTLHKIFSVRCLQKYQYKVDTMMNNLVISANELKGKSFIFWLKGFFVTVLAWSFRFLVVNAIMFAFAEGENHILIFLQQVVLWNILTASPTPGGLGVGELLFKEYYINLFPTIGLSFLAISFWRIFTCYMYLFAGVFTLFGQQKNFNNNLVGE